MTIWRQKKNPARLFLRRLMLIGVFALVVAGAFGVWDTYQKERASATLKQEALAQLKDLSNEQSQLTASIGELETERGKEAALREQYSMADPGEHEVVIVEPASSS
ncbi:MAG TPA: hypothetical protein VMU27_02720, partial [Candidatus Paceibacterota bacterium]|nr:hypothetical protein [Candidatus Paceibacterota bacterium]